MKTKIFNMVAIALLAACTSTRDTKNAPRVSVSPMSQAMDGKGIAWSGPTNSTGANAANPGNVGSDTNNSAAFTNDQTGSNYGTNTGAMNTDSDTVAHSDTDAGINPEAMNSEAKKPAAPYTHGDLKITPVYKNSSVITVGGKTIYVNPGPKAAESQTKADVILFTEMPDETIADTFFGEITTKTAVIYAPQVISDKYPGKMKVISTGKKETWKSDVGDITIEAPNGQSYVLWTNKERVYLSGDKECFIKVTAPKENSGTPVLKVGKTTVTVPNPEEEVLTCL